MATGAYENDRKSSYPLTKMNFLVTVDTIAGSAAFSEITGVEATVDVIEFRQGNSGSLAPVKIPGLVKHGNVTLKMGYIISSAFKTWIMECVSETRGQIPRQDVTIELIDINSGAPNSLVTTSQGARQWSLKNAWVTKYTAPDLDAKNSDVAIETVEICYEELIIPN
ncbi:MULTISPECIES: phage tail protein [unclassified Butyrivibrio]|jgi:phage tail-like protein|uniref:phage tail protein n=1 Tax=unclassified Butyrivibrio TaxID=2639466 RepID=UPI0003B3C76F|nr:MULTISPECIES: phage tail protein [unclassified Butyrivibrio]MDC7294005.1 phage tail protein [Butyrivibrio sp. DSM 10294]